MADAYTSVDVTGTVTDTDGKAVSGAKVILTSQQGAKYKIAADKSGTFHVNQIPSGHYAISIQADGMKPFRDVFTSGTGSASYGFTMQKEGEVETVVVTGTGTKAVADFQSTDVGLSVDLGTLSNQIPLSRSVIAAVEMAPGVTATASGVDATRRNQSTASLAGSSGAESVYYINGINVTDQRTLIGYAEMPYDMVQTVDTKTGGYQAEFGRATGGVINMTSKSGTDEWHFGAHADWEPNSMRSNIGTTYYYSSSSAGAESYHQHQKTNYQEQSFWLGGPLLKDHIFMFANINPQQKSYWTSASYASSTTTNGTEYYEKQNSTKWGAKFDFVLNEDQRIEYTIFSDAAKMHITPYNVTGREDSVITPTSSTLDNGARLSYWEKSGGINHIVKYTGRFTNWFTLSAQFGQINSSYKDGGAAADTPAVYDYVAGAYQTQATASTFDTDGLDTRNTYRVDGDFYFKVYGEHHVKLGYDREDMTSKTNDAYNSGAYYRAYSQATCETAGYSSGSDGCILKYVYAHSGKFKASQSAVYLQDNWQVLPNLALKLGVRDDIYDYKNGDGESYLKTSNQWAPRVGFSWDPRGEGEDKVYGSFGDYYLPIAMNTSIREVSGETFTETFYEASRDSSGTLLLNSDNTPVMGNQLGDVTYLAPPGSPDPKSIAAKDLDPMYEREFILGYEHNFHNGFFEGWTMGLRWVHRQLMSTIEDTAIGDAVGRWCQRTGTTCETADGLTPDNDPTDFSSYFNYVLINPGKAADVYVDLQGDSSTSADYDPQWIHLTKSDLNLPKAKRHYNAVTYTFERPFDGTWGVQGSYTWSESVGNYEGAIKSDIGQSDTSITQDFDHAASMIGSYGALPNDHKHQFKIYGTYSPLPGLITGLSFTAKSGRPYSCIGYAPSSADSYATTDGSPSGWYCPWGSQTSTSTSYDAQQVALGGATGEYEDVLVGRDKYKTPWTFQFDLHTAYTYASDAYGAYTLSFDVFNLFNANRVTSVVEQGAIYEQPNIRDAVWGKPYTRQSPRFVRIGVSYDY